MTQRVLVIDDEEGIRDAFELALDNLGYTVETAGSGEEGLRKALARRPDLVFLDMKMPGMDGVETLRRLQGYYPDLPVYIVTAFYEDYMQPLKDVVDQGLEFQVAKKPLEHAEIRAVVQAILDGPRSV